MMPLSIALKEVAIEGSLGYSTSMTELTETYRYIVKTPGVCGGDARIEQTRICVHDVIGLL